MSMRAPAEITHGPYLGIFLGKVYDNVDPRGLGRVRVLVPGICEAPASNWASPIGIGGGDGAYGFGNFMVPPVGGAVVVQFLQGYAEHPFYQLCHWGTNAAVQTAQTGGQERDDIPVSATQTPISQRPNLIVLAENAEWLIAATVEPGKSKLMISHKDVDATKTTSSNFIMIDGEKNPDSQGNTGLGIWIKGKRVVDIRADGMIRLKAPVVEINGRTVLPTGSPI